MMRMGRHDQCMMMIGVRGFPERRIFLGAREGESIMAPCFRAVPVLVLVPRFLFRPLPLPFRATPHGYPLLRGLWYDMMR